MHETTASEGSAPLADIEAMNLVPDSGRPLTGGEKTRFMLGFAVNGLLWTIGLMIVFAVIGAGVIMLIKGVK